MKLADLMSPWLKIESPDCEIQGLHNDSRQIRSGYLFFAYPGAATDGRFYIPEAIKQGAIAVLYEPNQWPSDCQLTTEQPCIAVSGLAEKLAAIASRFYQEPRKKLAITGVTGTNGKTTIAYLLAQAHALIGEQSAYIGTIGHGEVNALQPLSNTTPDALLLQKLLHHYAENSIKQVCMEVSSHALCQNRVGCIDFQQAIFSNLSHEHLDYHQSMEAYAAAKAKLFANTSLLWAILNQDDPYSQVMRKNSRAKQILTYGIREGADVRALDWNISLAGTHLKVVSPWGAQELRINALGFFNIYNTLAVYSSLLASSYSIQKVASLMTQLKAAPGRMEIISKEPYIIVDYAHSPDALENVLKTLQELKKGRLLLVFGCGGDRDKAKRPMMGKIASLYADLIIITSDNPRREDPLAIIESIETGMDTKTTQFKIPNREEAIVKAISLANKEDIILVAGKGHEEYQEIDNVRHYFSDQALIRQFIQKNPSSPT